MNVCAPSAPRSQYIGRLGYAQMLGVTLRTFDRYRALNLVLKPTRTLRGRPMWLLQAVEQWMQGRAR
jgi:hypothetical protein